MTEEICERIGLRQQSPEVVILVSCDYVAVLVDVLRHVAIVVVCGEVELAVDRDGEKSMLPTMRVHSYMSTNMAAMRFFSSSSRMEFCGFIAGYFTDRSIWRYYSKMQHYIFGFYVAGTIPTNNRNNIE